MNQSQFYINAIPAALYAQGVRHAVISPGSRNAPLIMAFSRFGKIKCHSVIDERSAGFMALGMSINDHIPAVVICTSGSALANLYPSVLEAYYMQVPMIVISADRPSSMIDKWDGQTIHQQNFFSKHIKASFVTPENPSSELEMIQISNMAFYESLSSVRGPVHINVPLHEPLYAAVKETFEYPTLSLQSHQNSDTEYLPEKLQEDVVGNSRVLLLFGANFHKSNIDYLKKHQNCVVLADIISNQRHLSECKNWESILLQSSPEKQKDLLPDVIISFGKMLLNKTIKHLLREHSVKAHWHIDVSGYCADTFNTNPKIVKTHPSEFFDWLNSVDCIDSDYQSKWINASIAQRKHEFESETFNEFSALAKILKSLSGNDRLHLSNSMTVRNAAYNANVLASEVMVYSNRGVSGIDGCTSTVFGMAKIDTENNHTLITGDIAFLYDQNALLNQTFPKNLRIIVMNNGGGGIFKLLDGPSEMQELDEFVFTSHHLSLKSIADVHLIDYLLVDSYEKLDQILNSNTFKSGIIEIPTNSEINTKVFKKYKSIQI